jgi:hypothetical protein
MINLTGENWKPFLQITHQILRHSPQHQPLCASAFSPDARVSVNRDLHGAVFHRRCALTKQRSQSAVRT